jgi:hypothetical protein
MRHDKEKLTVLAKQVLDNINEPFVQTGLLMLSMVTGYNIEECKVKIKQMSEGVFDED